MGCFLGIDTGATKTHALIADENGRIVGFGEAGPGNHEVVGYEGVAAALGQSTAQALAQAGISASQIAGAGFGIAGYDFPSEREPTLQAIATLGLSCPLEATNDVVLGLIAGAEAGWGIVIDAGTGNNVRGRDRQGREGWVTGCGRRFGEHGGAGEIVGRSVQMIAYDWSHRGQKTALSTAFIQALGAKNLGDLIEGMALDWYLPDASLARLVFEVAAEGDAVAREVIRWSAHELGETAKAVIRQLEIQDEPFETVLIGSVFKGGELFTRPLRQTIRSLAPKTRFARLHAPPAAGGVLLGMEQAGLRDPRIRRALIESLKTAPQFNAPTD